MKLLITTLAEYQTRFWLDVGLKLRARGVETAFLSFDDRSTEMLEQAGLPVFPAGRIPLAEGECEAVLERFGIDNLNFWCAHERHAFGVRDSHVLLEKLARSALLGERACKQWLVGHRGVMVQELGGFLSVVGAYHAARACGYDNLFIEPSFFRGRLFFLRNSFAAARIPRSDADDVPAQMSDYLEETLRTGAIVIPQKDRHQYTTARQKIVNVRNARRLAEKLVDKYVHGKRQEFGHIGSHVSTHASMLFNSYRLRDNYTSLQACGRFVYYPLHVPGDMALTLRSPHLLDQLALIDYVCRSVPATHRVVVKEHPAMVGATNAVRMKSLLERYDNLSLVAPSTNNYRVLSAAEAVVSINSKSGAEAGLLGKPVLVLGDAFYRDAPFASALDDVQDLPRGLHRVLARDHRPPERADVFAYFADVWRQTLPGELYAGSAEQIETFVASLVAATADDTPAVPIALRC